MLNEALLEMFFFPALMSHFQSRYGASHVRLLKPSTRREVWVGFDQGWVVTDRSEEELFEDIRVAVKSSSEEVEHLFLGFFLQFKVVHQRTRRSLSTPKSISPRYFQAAIDLEPSKVTALSQHETLMRVNKINRGAAAYACPLIMNADAIYEGANLADLMCVPLDTAPDDWSQREEHLIVMQDRASPTVLWCSDPKEGQWYPFIQWVERVGPQSASDIRDLIGAIRRDLMNERLTDQLALNEHEVLPQSLVVVEIERAREAG
jgi:hypothetical protein